MDKAILISIKPKYASLIYAGYKVVELRRVIPTQFEGHMAYIYETAPISKVTGFFVVGGLISLKKDLLWKRFGSLTMVSKTDFDNYFHNHEMAHGIISIDAHRFVNEVEITTFGLKRPPQSWCYVPEKPIQGFYSI